ncbi:MAG: xanthine dehydrogenase family protein molybdopterin-binding subunit [Acidimicrobiales bacterium]
MSTERGVVLRREDGPLLRGQGSFIDGLRHPLLEGALHAAFVRSTEAHATIVSIDTAAALATDGVVAVFTAADLNLWPLPPRLPMMNKAMVRPMLADGVVRFVGEPVAMVVATDRYRAADGLEGVNVQYQPLPVLTDLDRSRDGEVLLHPAADTNISLQWAGKPFEEDPFANCDVVVSFDLRHPRLAPSPIEPRAGAVAWGPDGRATVWVCSQRPAGAKYVIECSMGLEPGTVRAIAPDVGGGFGAKGGYGCYPEDVVATFAARQLGRPIRWCETRSEAMVAMGHGRASRHRVRIGGQRDGTVVAYEVDALQDSGAYPAMGTNVTTNLRNSGTGVYTIAHARMAGTSVVTNTTPTVAFRGAGRPEAAGDIERAMDRFAAAIGMDPLVVRQRNVVAEDAFPYKTATGSTYDSGRYGESLQRAADAAGYRALRDEQARRRANGDRLQLGIGVSCTVEITGGGEGETASLTMASDGAVTVIVGTSPHGQGHETTFASVVASELGIDPEQVTVLHSDTDLSPFGGGTIGSRSAQLGGSAAHGAARAVIDKARERAAELLEANPDDVVFDPAGAHFHVAGTPARYRQWADLGAFSADFSFKPAGGSGTYAFGSCVAVIELDTETGAVTARQLVSVDDAGTLLNPLLAEGQVHGGLGLAVGAALLEEMIYDPDGTPRTANFADYPVISATETPSFDTHEMETPTPLNPLGVKGVGESGTVVATPALQSAVLDALVPFGVTHLDLPYSPERVWRAMQQPT